MKFVFVIFIILGNFRLRVDNAIKIDNKDISGILQKSAFERSLEETKNLGTFSKNLETQVRSFYALKAYFLFLIHLKLNEKLKPNFGADVRNINRLTLIPTSDNQIIVSFDVNTFEISKLKADSLKSNMQDTLSKSDIFTSFKNFDKIFEFKNITTGAFIVNGVSELYCFLYLSFNILII